MTGGSLTNVAIDTAMTNINLMADRYEWQCYQFVQRLLSLLGIQTEEIKFKRQTLVNRSEIVADIAVMRDYIDQETALKLNPYIDQEEIKEITERLAAESVAAAPMPETEVV
jgi:precorrin isomerase